MLWASQTDLGGPTTSSNQPLGATMVRAFSTTCETPSRWCLALACTLRSVDCDDVYGVVPCGCGCGWASAELALAFFGVHSAQRRTAPLRLPTCVRGACAPPPPGNVYEAIYGEAAKSPLNQSSRMVGWDKFKTVLDMDFLKRGVGQRVIDPIPGAKL